MKIGAFITITNPGPRGDMFDRCYWMATECFDVVTVVDGYNTWPYEFSWDIIGKHFQWGYEETEADWVVHLDCDFFFHEDDFKKLREVFAARPDSPALSFYKYQFIQPECYNLKSRLVIAVNKGKFGDRIRFDSGGDLCQPSLDGKEIKAEDVPQAEIPFYNYEKLIKTQAQIKDDVGRMARAWRRHFGDYKLGGPDNDSAWQEWLTMVRGRFSKPQTPFDQSKHPKYVQEAIKNLTPEQWGGGGFGLL